MTDGEDDGRSRTLNRPEVMGKTKDGPVIRDGTEICILSVGQLPVVNELSADSDVSSGLESRPSAL